MHSRNFKQVKSAECWESKRSDGAAYLGIDVGEFRDFVVNVARYFLHQLYLLHSPRFHSDSVTSAVFVHFEQRACELVLISRQTDRQTDKEWKKQDSDEQKKHKQMQPRGRRETSRRPGEESNLRHVTVSVAHANWQHSLHFAPS